MQSAYEVLSDPQERAWYDSHEDAILRDIDPTASSSGGDDPDAYEHNVGLTTADDITRLVRKFHGGVDFSDAPDGFFGFLRDFFETLAREETAAARKDGGLEFEYPSFGHKNDDYDDVVRGFYNIWTGFSTHKSFAWRDKYRASDAEDRRMRRLIDKENARFRREGAAEFNDAVRALVAFVRKRDPRYTPNMQSEAERQKVLRDAAAAQAARMRAANAAKMQAADVVPDWAKSRERDPLEEHVGQLGEESSSEEEHFECMACRKTFKSEKQWEAHERSKKHQKAVAALRKKLQKEGHNLGLDDEADEEVSLPASDDGVTPADDEDAPVNAPAAPQSEDDEPPVEADSDDSNVDQLTAKTQSLATDDVQAKTPPQKNDTSTSSDSEDEGGEDNTTRQSAQPPSSDEDDSKPTQAQAPKKGKAAQKRAKKAAQQTAAEQSESRFSCATCAAPFPSKTRLFQHIKDHGHAAPASQTGKAAGGVGSGKKGKKR